MRDNYKAWGIDLGDFEQLEDDSKRLGFLLRFAVLAPSSHNSQPWQFLIKDGDIIIKPDFSRALKSSDANNRQLYISLGCALANLLVAAEYYNYQTSFNIEKASSENYQIIIKLKRENSEEKPDKLIKLITERVTNRNKHTKIEEIDSSFIREIAEKYGPNFKLELVEDKPRLLKIADLSIQAGIKAMEDAGFRQELSQYVKNNTTKAYTGMPCFGMGIPTPISYFAPVMIKLLNMNKLSEKSDRNLLENQTQALLIISSKVDDIPNWIITGKIYQEISLGALSRDLFTSPMAGIIQIGNYYQNLQEILQTDFRPQFFCRLGHTEKKVHHSPRLPVEKVLT
jgi:hypothetical protein